MKMSDGKLGKVFCVCRVIYIDTLVWGTKFCLVATPVARPPPFTDATPWQCGACNKCLAGRKFIDGKLGFKVNYDKFVARFSFYCQQRRRSTALAGHPYKWGDGETGREEADKINVCKVCNEPKKERSRRTRSMSEFNCPVVWLIEKSQVFRRRK